MKGLSVKTFVCGPDLLEKSVSECSFKYNFDFHSETFEL